MAKVASLSLFLFLLFLLLVSSSGTLVGFLYDARKSTAIPSANETISFLKKNKVRPSQIRILVADYRVLDSFPKTDVSIDLYLNETLANNLRNHEPSAISWLKAYLSNSVPHVKIKNIIISSSSKELPKLSSTLKSIHSIIANFHLESEIKVSISLPLSLLESSNRKHERYLSKAFDFMNRTRSFLVVEAKIDGELSMGDHFVESVLERATLATFLPPCNDVKLVLIVWSSAFPSEKELAEFNGKISRFLNDTTRFVEKKIVGLFAEISQRKDFERKELEREEQMFHSFHRELTNNFNIKTTKHDFVYPPTTTFPTTPITNPVTTPVTSPPANAAPIVTVPGTNQTPNPPSTTVPPPDTDPVSSPLPITNPVTTPNTTPGNQPATNPVTTYPAPSAGVPVTTPVTTPVTAPTTGNNAPTVPGQSWCVAKSGAAQTALQSALDYACGIGEADCWTIQQSGSCYNPNTLQNHASYAFNSYYQKNPGPTSCDFGGAAMITNTNPSTGSCVYPLLSSSSSPTPTTTAPASPMPTTAAPALPTPTTAAPALPTPTTAAPASPTPTTAVNGGASSGLASPPAMLNGSNPAAPGSPLGFSDIPPSGFGESPPIGNTTSMSTNLRPYVGCIFLVTSIVIGKFILDT